jgi:thiamine biosynthesis lipoprotein
MKRTTVSMAMSVIVNIADKNAKEEDISEVFAYLDYIDNKFSTYKKNSEISYINQKLINEEDYTSDMKKVLLLSEETKKITNGYFDINHNGKFDPSGIVKGFAIYNASNILRKKGYKNIYLEIAGDIQVYGKDEKGNDWKIGIQNPFENSEMVKVVKLSNKGIATSGTYIRGNHIYNPVGKNIKNDIVSFTVIGPNIYEADRFATAAFAMGEKGLDFIVTLEGFEGYIIRKDKQAIYTEGFEKYIN